MEVVLGWLLKIIPIFEWVKVNGSKYWPHIVMVLVGWHYFALNAEYKELISYSSKAISALELQVEDYEGCRTESPDGDPPLRVTFTDERVAFANFFQVVLPLSPPVLPLFRRASAQVLAHTRFAARAPCAGPTRHQVAEV